MDGDPMIKSSQTLPNSKELSVYTTFGACDGSKNYNKLFFSFHEKFWFHTVKIVSSEWRELVPRQRTGDCSEIHFLH